jgi:hypothetical protein
LSGSAAAEASDNTVNISDGQIGEVSVYGGLALSNAAATASCNTVNISGGRIEGASVYGGSVQSNGDDDTAAATSNRVNIRAGTIAAKGIAGGYSVVESGTTGSATDNVVALYGTPNLSGTTLYGGFVSDDYQFENAVADADAFTGNTLKVIETAGLAVAGLFNFHHLNFTLPRSIKGNDTVLTVAGVEDGTVNGLEYGTNGTDEPTLDVRTPSGFFLEMAENSEDGFNGSYILLRNAVGTQALGDIGAYSLYDAPFSDDSLTRTLTLDASNPGSRVRGGFWFSIAGGGYDLQLNVSPSLAAESKKMGFCSIFRT